MHINCDNFNIYRRSLVFPSAAITRHDVAIPLCFFLFFCFVFFQPPKPFQFYFRTLTNNGNIHKSISWKKWELNGIESDDNRRLMINACGVVIHAFGINFDLGNHFRLYLFIYCAFGCLTAQIDFSTLKSSSPPDPQGSRRSSRSEGRFRIKLYNFNDAIME